MTCCIPKPFIPHYSLLEEPHPGNAKPQHPFASFPRLPCEPVPLMRCKKQCARDCWDRFYSQLQDLKGQSLCSLLPPFGNACCSNKPYCHHWGNSHEDEKQTKTPEGKHRENPGPWWHWTCYFSPGLPSILNGILKLSSGLWEVFSNSVSTAWLQLLFHVHVHVNMWRP